MTDERTISKLRRTIHRQLEPSAWIDAGLSPTNSLIVTAIFVAVIASILESEPTLLRGRETLFFAIEFGFAMLFIVEYLLRVWVVVETPGYGTGWRARLRYVFSLPALIDLLAIVPFFFLAFGSEAYLLRLVRLLRILRLAKLGRFSVAMTAVYEAVRSRRYELSMSVIIAFSLLLTSSTLLYLAERHVQPEAFGSIPRAMWWSTATLTTVGYGDVYPVTALGRLFAAITAFTGVGLIAIPTGIMAAAFSNALEKRRHDFEEFHHHTHHHHHHGKHHD